jgi:hypothetical protein
LQKLLGRPDAIETRRVVAFEDIVEDQIVRCGRSVARDLLKMAREADVGSNHLHPLDDEDP